jgi:signal transduction histidine kinase
VNRLNTAMVRWFGEFAENGIFTTDDALVITSWNRWLERHSGRLAAELIGRPLLEAWPELQARGVADNYREALTGRAHLVSHLLHGALLTFPTSLPGQPVTNMPQRARIAPLILDDRVIGTITVIHDVTDRVAAEHELRKQIEAQRAARAAAEVALRVKDEFLTTLSHEIRTPLSSVLGWTKILRENCTDPEVVARAIEVINRNATLQLRMIDDLLDTARIMAGKLRLRMEPVDVASVASAALDAIEPAAQHKGVKLQRCLQADLPRVLGDADRLQQVFWNLLSNALKFTPAGRTIQLQFECAGESIQIAVRDDGIGISREFLPFVFERFSQAQTDGRRESGLGLGLPLVKELVSMHGGTIVAQSAGPQQGAAFIVRLPALAPTDV